MSRSATPLRTIYALKNGVVPQDGIKHLTVGRAADVRTIRQNLVAVATSERPAGSFVVGDYGEGKSHLLHFARALALDEGFAVCGLTVDFTSMMLHRPKLVIKGLSRQLEVPDQHAVGLIPSLRNIRTIPTFRKNVEMMYRRWSSSLYGRPRAQFSIWPSALYAICKDEATLDPVGQWLGGGSIPIPQVRRAISSTCTPPHRMSIYIADVPEIIAGLATTLHHLEYKGLVLIFDELENALSSQVTPRQRSIAANLLRELLKSKAPLYVIGALTPSTVIQIRQDIGIYADYGEEWHPDFGFLHRRLKDGAAIQLRKLNRRELVGLGTQITKLHSSAFGWNGEKYLTEERIRALLQVAEEDYSSLRTFVRVVVHALEICEQNREHFGKRFGIT